MGQKVDPRSVRLGITREWDRVWFAPKKTYSKFLLEDQKIEEFLKREIYKAGVARIFIYRRVKQITVDVYCARPGMIIGKGGTEAEAIRMKLERLTQKKVQLNVKEQQNVAVNAVLLADNVAVQLAKRIPFRRAMKQAITRALRGGAHGIKIRVGGRLNGSEIARGEWYREGRVPLQTFRADIDYGFTEAHTTYGKIGVKVWIYKGDVLDKKNINIDDLMVRDEVGIEEERENVNA